MSVVTTVLLLIVLTARIDQVQAGQNRPERLLALQGEARSQANEMAAQVEAWTRLAGSLSADPRLMAALAGRGPADPAAMDALSRLQGADPSFRSVELLRADGGVALALDPAAYSEAVPGPARALFATALAGRPVASGVVVGDRLPAPTIFIAAPLGPAGRVAGLALVQVDAQGLTSFQLPTLVEPDRFEMLVDDNGVVIGYNGPAAQSTLFHSVGSPSPARVTSLHLSGAYDGESLAPLGMPDLAASLGRGEQGNARVRFSPTGRAAETGFAQVPGLGWSLLVIQDEPVFLATQDAFTFNVVLTVALAAVGIVALTFAVVRLLERAETESLHDELTHLPNRRYFRDVLEREISRAERSHRPFSLINLDLDHFKAVNDAFGHPYGDTVLSAFATLLNTHVRSIDLAARFGGEEFVVMLPDTDKEGASLVAEKVRRATARLPASPYRTSHGVRSRVTVSAGISSYPEDGATAEMLLRRADQAMYLAKSLGRNQVISFGSPVPLSSAAGDQERFNLLVRNANQATVEALAAALDARDEYTHGHSRRVADISLLIGRELELPRQDLDLLNLGALLHDVGKIGVPDAILQKPGRLSATEFRQVQDHTRIGFQMVQEVEFLRPVGPIILHHHENMDGTGYPDRLAGQDIPMLARIVKVADAFDAMMTARTYREAATVEWAMGELTRNAGNQFDADVVDALRHCNATRRLAALLPTAAVAS